MALFRLRKNLCSAFPRKSTNRCVGLSVVLAPKSKLRGYGEHDKNLFWLNDDEWQEIEPFLPMDVRGKDRVDDRRVIGGILHALKSGC
jgi:hypothetical protein